MEDSTFAPAGVGVTTILFGSAVLASVERPTSAEARVLEQDYGVSRADLDLALARATPAALVRRDGYVLIRAPVPVVTPRSETLIATPVSFIVGRDFLLLVHAGEVRPLLRLLREFETDETLRAEVGSGGIEALLRRCFERLLDAATSVQARVERQADEAEAALARGGARTEPDLGRLVRLREDVRLINRVTVPLARIARQAADLGLPSEEWEQTANRASRLAEAAADNRAAQDGLMLVYAAEASARTARYARGLLLVAALTLPALAVAMLASLPYGNPLATVAVGSAIALAIVGLVFIGSLYLLRRQKIL